MTAVAQPEVSRLGAAYERVYGMLAGTRPGLLPWHFQWLATCDIRRDMAEVLPSCRGELLDIGCGAKPYRALAKNVDRYIGMGYVPAALAPVGSALAVEVRGHGQAARVVKTPFHPSRVKR